jgi:hypothetical protein
MSKQPAPSKLTGGGGFVFEDKVSAYFLSHMLTGQPPFSPTLGLIKKIEFQVRPLGWFLDDILLTLESKGTEHRFAFSVKSNKQFSGDKAPRDFVNAAWEQFLGTSEPNFSKEQDRLGLITSTLPHGLRKELIDILDSAAKQDPHTFVTTIQAVHVGNEVKRSFLQSFNRDVEFTAKIAVNECTVGELLKCVSISDFDFDQGDSTRAKETLRNCQNALRSGSISEAQNLCDSLNLIAADYRPKAGSLSVQQLIDLLRSRYELKDFPSYQSDWGKLAKQTGNNLSSIQDKIGNRVHLLREKDLDNLEQSLILNKAVVLLGPSGCGKTVLAKSISAKMQDACKVLWWKATSLEERDMNNFELRLGLSNPLSNLIDDVVDKAAYVVIDGVDRTFKPEAFEIICTLIRRMRLESDQSPWHVLITTQSEEWERIQMALGRANAPPIEWKELQIKEPSVSELDHIWSEFPALAPLRWLTHLQPLLLKPKVLDLIAMKLVGGRGPDASNWVGESDLIQWFWEDEIAGAPNGAERARFLRLLGERQADDLISETPVDQITELAGFDSLRSDRICKFEQDRVSFSHDLYGDWARQRIIITNESRLGEYLGPKLESPLWHKALRLYGLHLLEQHEDIGQWKSAFDALGADHTAQDLLLDSALFAAQPLMVLERLWPELAKDRAALLARLLTRFLHIATFPNPSIMQLALKVSPDYSTHAATLQRVPNFPLWIPMLGLLSSHKEEVLSFNITILATIADLWLRFTDSSWPFRNEAADLVISLAEEHLGVRMSQVIYVDRKNIDSGVFKSALAACKEYHSRTVTLALIAAGRRESEGNVLKAKERLDEEIEQMRQRSASIKPKKEPARPTPSIGSFFFEGEMRPPWPFGPAHRVDSAFRHACLETDALHALILLDPTAAKEIILALLIAEPSPTKRYKGSMMADRLEVENHGNWFPPFYTKGPFLFFMMHQPQHGLQLVLDLVNFVTERWGEIIQEEYGFTPTVDVELPEGTVQWVGDSGLYFAYRDSNVTPHAVATALMSLEKWLYDQIEKKDQASVAEAINKILSESKSVAFAGLLSAVGRKQPELLSRELLPLLTVPEFHLWELAYSLQNHDYLMMGWHRESSLMKKMVGEWHQLSHRKRGLDYYAQWLFLNKGDLREFFASTQGKWVARSKSLPEGSGFKKDLENLALKYDPANWKSKPSDDGDDVWTLELPEEVKKRNEQVIEENNNRIFLMSFPINARRIIDGQMMLGTESLEEFWSQVRKVAEMKSTADEEVVTIDDAVAGGIAVLIRIHREWLKKHPDRDRWCSERLRQIVSNRTREETEIIRSISNSTWIWDYFCAEAIPILWSENIDSKVLRQTVVNLALKSRNTVTQAFFASSAGERILLGDSFHQLENLFFEWEVLRWQKTTLERTVRYNATVGHQGSHIKRSTPVRLLRWLLVNALRFDPDVGPVRRKMAHIEKRMHRLEHAFILGRTTVERAYLNTPLVVEQNPRTPTKAHWEGKLFVENLDLSRIQAAFRWLPSLDSANSVAEREECKRFWWNALDATIKLVESDRDEYGRIRGTPSSWDRWVIETSVRIILAMKPNDQPSKFWQAILDLGPEAHYWTDDFFTEWFNIGLVNPKPFFIQEWRKMIEYAFGSEIWNFEKARSSFDLEDLWCQLFGLNPSFINLLWIKGSQPAIDQIRDFIERWAKHFLVRPRMATRFLYFLEQDASESLRLPALLWLEQAVSSHHGDYWREDHIEERTVSYLDLCWRNHRKDLRSNAPNFTSFKRLLKILGDRQNSVALEMLDQLAKGL